MPAFYDFFRKLKFRPNVVTTLVPGAITADTTIEADSVTDTATIVAGQNISFGVSDTITSPGQTTDTVTINGPDYQTYVPLGTTKLRLEKNLGDATSDIELQPDPMSPILITRMSNNVIKIGASTPSLPFSQEQIEDISASLLSNGTHTDLTVSYFPDAISNPSVFSQNATSGSGINAKFNIAIINNAYEASVNTAGSGYVVGQTVTVFGTNWTGGLNPTNNAVITIGTVDGGGGILTITSITGTPIPSDNIDLAVTSTLETTTGRGASSTNAITISNATGSSNTSTGALKLTAGGLAVFENVNVGGYVKATTLQSTQATGTAPLTVASTTMVTNLQAETASKWHTARTVTFTGDVTGTFTIDGSADLTNVALTVGSNTVALGTDTTGNYVATAGVSGNGLSGSSTTESGTFTVSSNATAVNTAETIVFRDTSGNFSAGTISAALNGNASTVTNGFYTTSSFNLGTTSIAVNRVSAAQSLTGITSIDGYAQGLAGGNATTLLGALPYQSNTNSTSLLAPNTTTNKRFLRMTGTGTNGAAPAWDSVTATDVGLGNVTNESKSTMFASPTFTGTVSLGASTIETLSINPAALTGAVTLDCRTNSVFYYTSNASANWTLNFRGDGSTTMNAFLAVGQSVTVVLLATQGVTAFFPTAFTVDGTAVGVTVEWLGGAAPTGGNASSVDSYSFTIVETAASTYTIFASQARFA
jgi:hypothetical protein